MDDEVQIPWHKHDFLCQEHQETYFSMEHGKTVTTVSQLRSRDQDGISSSIGTVHEIRLLEPIKSGTYSHSEHYDLMAAFFIPKGCFEEFDNLWAVHNLRWRYEDSVGKVMANSDGQVNEIECIHDSLDEWLGKIREYVKRHGLC